MTLRTALLVTGDSTGGQKALADLDGAIARTEQKTVKMGGSAGAVGTQMAAAAQSSARAAVGAGAGYTVLTGAVEGNTIAMRESLVVTRELATGNLTRLPGSLSILAQQFATSGQSGLGFATQILQAFGIISKVGDEELASAAASAAATANLVRGAAERAQGAITAADAELLLAEAAVRNAEGSTAEAAAQERLAAAHGMVAAAAAEAAVAEDALAVAEDAAGTAAVAAGAETTLALGPIGIALGIVAVAAIPVIAGFKAIKAELDRQKLDDFARSLHLTADESANLNDHVVSLVEKLEKNAADARDAATAHEIYAHTISGSIGAIDDLTKGIEKQNLTLEDNISLQKRAIALAIANAASNVTMVSGQLAAAVQRAKSAQDIVDHPGPFSTGQEQVAGIQYRDLAVQQVRDLNGELHGLSGALDQAAIGLRSVDYPLYTRNAKEATDATARINREFDDQIKKAQQAGTYTRTLANSIEGQRQSALAAAKATDTHSGAIGRHGAAAHAAKPQVDDLSASVRRLLDELFPIRAAEDKLADETDLLTRAWRAGTISAEEYGAAIRAAQSNAANSIAPPKVDIQGGDTPLNADSMKNALGNIENSLPKLTDSTDQWKQAMSELGDIGKSTLKNFNDGFAKLATSSKSFGDFWKGLKGLIHDTAESALQDLIKLAMKEAEMALFKALFGASFGGGFADGGKIEGFADGGRLIQGPGTGTSDSILAVVDGRKPIAVSNGESINTAAATQRYWPLIDAMNRGAIPGFADGGIPSSPPLFMPSFATRTAANDRGPPSGGLVFAPVFHNDFRGADAAAVGAISERIDQLKRELPSQVLSTMNDARQRFIWRG